MNLDERKQVIAYCEKMIENCNDAICSNLTMTGVVERGMISVNILSQLRNLIEHVSVRLYLNFARIRRCPKSIMT